MSKQTKTLNLNFGPQHTAAKRILILILQLEGEVVATSNPHIGLFHRVIANLPENNTYYPTSA